MKTKIYLISCLMLLARYSVKATDVDDCGCDEDLHTGQDTYVAEGSAISSQVLLPDGTVETHAKGGSISSGIRQTFETLKHEANQFVSKQKDTISVPNVHIPVPAHVHPTIDNSLFEQQAFAAANALNSAQAGYTDTKVYPQVPLSKVTSIKTEHTEHKKVITKGTAGSPLIPVDQSEQTEYVQPAGSEFSYASVPNAPISALGSQILSQTYENSAQQKKHQESSSSYHTHLPTNTGSSGGVQVNLYPERNEGYSPFVTSMVPIKIISTEKRESQTSGTPIKIRYSYDGKSAVRTEEYSNGETKYFPITYEQYQEALSQNPGTKVTVHKTPTVVHKYQAQSHSHSETYGVNTGGVSHQVSVPSASGGYYQGAENLGSQGGSLVHKLLVPVKQESSGEVDNLSSAGAQGALVHGIQTVPGKHSSSSSSGYSYQSSSSNQYAGTVGPQGTGTHGSILVHGVPVVGGSGTGGYSSSSYSSSSSQYGGTGGVAPSKGTFHEIKTSYASSSSNVNGKKTENREASVSVNENGKVDSYHVKS